jgi:hypothetical protein
MLIQTPRTSKLDFRLRGRTVAITAAWMVAMLVLSVAALLFTTVSVDELGAEPTSRVVPAQLASPTGEVDLSSAEPIARLDHTGIEAHAMAHDSDAPGASIAAYGP